MSANEPNEHRLDDPVTTSEPVERRDVLKALTTGALSLTVLPTLLNACRKSEWPSISEPVPVEKIVIIGAGISGLCAARLLKAHHYDITILEASSQPGGRIRKLENFSDFPIDLGADTIRGNETNWSRLVKTYGGMPTVNPGSEYLTLDGVLRNSSELTTEFDYLLAKSVITGVENYNGSDISIDDYVLQQGIATRMLHYMNARLGNFHGASNGRMSILGLARAKQAATSGGQNMSLQNGTFYDILTQYCSPVLSHIRFNSAVTAIDYTNDTIIVTDSNKQQYSATRVILTVPLTMLRNGSIQFTPALPTAKVSALDRIGMGAGMKIILKFSQRFWATDTDTIISDGYVPMYYPTGGNGRSVQNNTLTAFVFGEKAEYLSSLGQSAAVNLLLTNLNTIYGAGAASGNYTDSYLIDWGREAFIQGAFSYPIIGEGSARDTLATDVDNKLFFAGEATHTDGHHGTMHGAMETAERVANEILTVNS